MRPHDRISLSEHCSIVLHKTLRIPDDGNDYPLPPSLGRLPLFGDLEEGFVVPLHRTEALWLGFEAPHWKPHALKVGIGAVDAISGETFAAGGVSAGEQDYVVIPDQPWLDGINAGDGFIRQFVAVPLGEGLTVESQLSAEPEEGGMRLSLFAPRPGRFPDEPPPAPPYEHMVMACCMPASAEMGLGAGGRMRQEIYADDYGIDTWEPEPLVTVRVDLVDALAFEAVTGIRREAPVDAAAYTSRGFPWFDLIDPTKRDIAAAERLAKVRSVADLEGRRDEPLPIPEWQVRRLLQLRDRVA